jgi:hyperosmotically inducible periplasmic protein
VKGFCILPAVFTPGKMGGLCRVLKQSPVVRSNTGIRHALRYNPRTAGFHLSPARQVQPGAGMKTMRKPLRTMLLSSVVLACGAGLIWAQDSGATQPQSSGSTMAAPDNTKTNQRDRMSSEPTADQQKENKSDRELSREIRRAIVRDKSLSTDAHNVKIIAQGGTVTLKGPVKSDQEKQAVEAKAADVAGSPDKVKSELQVAGGSHQ